MVGHIIVSGADALAVRIAAELRSAGATVTVIDRADQLSSAGLATAASVVCAGADDAANLEMALLARRLSATVRVVTRLANGVLREAMAAGHGPGAVLDVADLAAPSVVEACLQRTTHSIAAGDLRFVVSGLTRRGRARCATSTAIWRRWPSCAARSRRHPVRWWPAPAAICTSTKVTGSP